VPSSNESTRNTSPPSAAKGNLGGASLGAFWSTEHAKDSLAKEDKNAPKFVDESPSMKEDIGRSEKHRLSGKASPSGRETNHPTTISGGDVNRSSERSKEVKSSGTVTSLNDAFNTFVAEFDSSKLSPGVGGAKLGKDDSLVAEIERLREQLKQANLEKAEITSKYEKLVAICRSQRQEIQELKQTLAARTPSPNKESLKNHSSSTNQSVNSQVACHHCFLLFFSFLICKLSFTDRPVCWVIWVVFWLVSFQFWQKRAVQMLSHFHYRFRSLVNPLLVLPRACHQYWPGKILAGRL